MAYATQYKIEFKSKTNALTTILIEKDGFTGSITELQPGASSPEFSKDESAPFMGTELSFSIESSSVDGMVSLYTENPRGFRVTTIRDSETIFQGFLVPEQYSDPYVDAPFDIQLSAVDGLGLLKNEDFDITGYASEVDVITHILSKTGLSLVTAVSLDVRVFNGYWGRALDMSYINCNQFYNDKGPESCYDVLSKILKSYDLTELYVTQHAGRWVIFRTIDILKEFTIYNTDGSVNTTDTFQFLPVRSFDSLSDNQGITSEGQLSRDLSKRVHKIDISNKLGRRSNMLPEILTWDDNDNSNWTITDGQVSKIVGAITSEDGYFLGRGKIEKSILLAFNDLSSSTQREYGEFTKQIYASTEEYRLNINTRVDGGYYYNNSYVPVSGSVNLPLVVILQGDSDTYILTNDGWEILTDIDNQAIIIEQDADVQKEAEVILSSLPVDGILKIRFYRPFNIGVNHRVNVNIYDIIFNLASLAAAFINYSLKSTDNVNNSIEEEIFGEAPNIGNAHLLYQNIKLNSNLLALEAWRHNDDTTDYKLSLVNLRANVSNNRKPKQILKGTLMGSGSASPGFNLSLVYVDYSVSSTPYFWLKSGTWNLYEDTLTGDFEEILPYQEQTVTIDKTVISENYSSENSNPVTSELSEGGSGSTTYANWNNLVNKPSEFPPTAHTHELADIPKLSEMFEYVANSGSPYIRGKLPFACDGEVMSFADNGQVPPSLWESLPYASATAVGGIKVGSGLSINNGVLSVEGSVGQGFDESENYNPSGDWDFTGTLNYNGNKVATESWATGQFESKFTKNTAFNKNFAGNGIATTVARSDHNHNTQYHPLGGSSITNFTVQDLTVHGVLNYYYGETLTVTDANIQVNAKQGGARVNSGLIVFDQDFQSELSKLYFGTDNRWHLPHHLNIAQGDIGRIYGGPDGNDFIEIDGGAGDFIRFVVNNSETLRSDGTYTNVLNTLQMNGNKVATESWVQNTAKAADSDKLDGFHAWQFLRSDVDDYKKGFLRFYDTDTDVYSNADARTDGNTVLLHKYRSLSTGGSTFYKEAWYDGSSYHYLGAKSTGFYFESSVDIDGHLRIENSSNPVIQLKSLTDNDSDSGKIIFHENTLSNTAYIRYDGSANKLHIGTLEKGDNPFTILRQSGYVGILNTSPTEALDVNGNGKFSGNIYSENKIRSSSRFGVFGNYASDKVQGIWSIDTGWAIDKTNNDFGNQFGIVYSHTNAGTTGSKNAIAGWDHQILFVMDGNRKASISLNHGHAWFDGKVLSDKHITGTGFTPNGNNESNLINLIVGVNSNGNTNGITFYESDGGYGMSLGYDGTGSGTGNKLAMYNNNGLELIQFDAGGNVTASGEVSAYSTSDYRLKKNIKPLSNALELISKYNVVAFNWNEKAKKLNSTKDDRLAYGQIAQELEKVSPELVHPIYNGKYKSIDYPQLININTKGIQELYTIIQDQSKRIQELEKRVN